MWKYLRSELLKLRKSTIWLLVFVSPLLSMLIGFGEATFVSELTEAQWISTLGVMTIAHSILFLPLLTGVFSSFICRYEHSSGGWKQLLSLPVSRRNVYIGKFLMVSLLIAVTQILFVAGLLCIGWMKGFSSEIPWEVILPSVIGGWIACLPLIALQLFASVSWSSFAAPLAINVIFTIPNILIVNSERFGPYYPWAQPFLMMMPDSTDSFGALHVSLETLSIVVLGSLLLFFCSGFMYFMRKEI